MPGVVVCRFDASVLNLECLFVFALEELFMLLILLSFGHLSALVKSGRRLSQTDRLPTVTFQSGRSV